MISEGEETEHSMKIDRKSSKPVFLDHGMGAFGEDGGDLLPSGENEKGNEHIKLAKGGGKGAVSSNLYNVIPGF